MGSQPLSTLLQPAKYRETHQRPLLVLLHITEKADLDLLDDPVVFRRELSATVAFVE